MFLDLWSLAILTGDLLELIVNHIESGTLSVSLPFVIFVIIFGTISAFAWRSTYIPDLPPVPSPPYVIQITGHQTILNNNGDGNALSDVRLLSSGGDVETTVFRRFTLPNSQGRNQNVTHYVGQLGQQSPNLTLPLNQSRTNNVRVYPHQQGQGQRQDASALLRFLRPGSVIRPFISNRATATGNQPPNLIVYHRVNVYHHHPPVAGANVTQGSGQELPTAVPSASATHSVDSFTQYETEDTSPVPEVIQHQPERLNVPPSHIDIQANEEDLLLESEASEEEQSALLSNQTHVPSTTAGLRHRSSLTQKEPGTIYRTGNSSSDIHASSSDSAGGSMMGHHDNHEINKDSQPGGVGQQTIPVEERVSDIRFTIKFLNDTQMEVTTQPGENIADFKRRHFATEMSENKTVRLIFNGRVLDNDTSTIRDSGIFDQCVVHCLIVARSAMGPSTTGNGGNPTQQQRRTGLIRAPEPGMFFVAFVGVFLIFLWFICFHFGQHLFTQSAVVSLTVLTAIFLIGLVAFYLPVHPNQ